MLGRVGKGIVLTAALIFLLAGCGGDDPAPASTGVRTAIALEKAALLPGQTIAGIQLTLHFPRGVTAKHLLDPNTQQLLVAPEVVQLLGPGAASGLTLMSVDYVPYTESSGGSLTFLAASATGFVVGDSIQIQLDVVTGFFPVAADFSVTGLQFSDLDGNLITGLESVVTVNVY